MANVTDTDTKETAHDVWDEVTESYSMMMGAKLGKLETPVTVVTSASGDRSEAEGSIRHICEFIEEAGHGYETAHEWIEETEGLSGPRHRYEVSVTKEE